MYWNYSKRKILNADFVIIIISRYWYTISNLIPRCDMVFPISTFIKDFYESKGTSTFIIPPLTEVRDETSKVQLPYKFILPANGKMKDNLESMICCISEFIRSRIISS